MSIETIFAHVSCSSLETSIRWYERLEPERKRLADAGLEPGPIEEARDFFILRLRDPDDNLVVLASAERS
jgi:hypothetical protein